MRFLTARWEHLVLLNYLCPPTLLEPLVPAGTELDTWQGETLVSLVGFLFPTPVFLAYLSLSTAPLKKSICDFTFADLRLITGAPSSSFASSFLDGQLLQSPGVFTTNRIWRSPCAIDGR